MNGSLEDAALLEAIVALLRSARAMNLATAGVDGPAAAAVFYATDEPLSLLFVSSQTSRHARDLVDDPRCAVTVHPEPGDWRDIVGVQMRGEARRIDERGRRSAERVYLARFPEVAALLVNEASGPVATRFAQSMFYRFVPQWVGHVDNRRGFGRRVEFGFDADRVRRLR